MALSVGVHVSATTAGGTALTLTTASRTLTAGSDVAVWTHTYSGGASADNLTTVTDSLSNTYAVVTSSSTGFNSDSHRHGKWYLAKNVTGGAATFTLTCTGGNDFMRLHVVEIKGTDTSADADQVAAGVGNAVTNLTSANITTTIANEILLLGGYDSLSSATASFADGAGSAATGGWTVQESISDTSTQEGAVATAIVSSTGTYAAKYTESGAAGNLGVSLISLKQAGGAAAQTPYNPWPQRAPLLAM